ncbi:adapter molecule Crk-like [Haliotis cracherodii]|uniref:adapter molecule Crk-like n=1 Tax=Haliotis cracherodii TaxID=6455 RepID=UPI0039E7ED33
MAADFDPHDKLSWYFGPLGREETNDILMNERDSGVFLVRESRSIRGDFVLCVREDMKVSHYIINRIQVGNQTRFRIGDQEFPDIPSLLNFYKTHYLDSTSLIKPAPRIKIVAKYDFPGRDPEDLPFLKGEVLEVISKDEESWWTARNNQGRVGQIPVPYFGKYQEVTSPPRPDYQSPIPPMITDVTLPAKATVITQRIPNAYDKTQLKLLKGEIITVTAMNVNGQWEGEVNGRTGIFPFTHVRFLSPEELERLNQ